MGVLLHLTRSHGLSANDRKYSIICWMNKSKGQMGPRTPDQGLVRAKMDGNIWEPTQNRNCLAHFAKIKSLYLGECILSDGRCGEECPQRGPHPKEQVDSFQRPVYLRLPSLWKDHQKGRNLQVLLEPNLTGGWYKQDWRGVRRWYFHIWIPLELTENVSILSETSCEQSLLCRGSFQRSSQIIYSDAMDRWIFLCVLFLGSLLL